MCSRTAGETERPRLPNPAVSHFLSPQIEERGGVLNSPGPLWPGAARLPQISHTPNRVRTRCARPI